MTTVQITYGFQDFSQFPRYRRLNRTWITSQHYMDSCLLLIAKSTLGTLDTVMNGKGYLTNGFLHLIHADISVKVTQYIVKRAFFWYITANILLLHHHSLSAATDERGKDVFCRLDGNMRKTECFVFNF